MVILDSVLLRVVFLISDTSLQEGEKKAQKRRTSSAAVGGV